MTSSSNVILSALLSLASSSSNSLTKILLKILSSRTKGNKQLPSPNTTVKSPEVAFTLRESNVPQLLEDIEKRLQLLTRAVKTLPQDTGSGLRTSSAQANEIHNKIDSLRPVLMRLTDAFDALVSFDRTDADYTLDKIHNTVNALLVFLQCIVEKKPVLEVVFGVRSRTIQDLQRLEMRFNDLFDAIFEKLPLHDHQELIPLENAVINGFSFVIGEWQAPIQLPASDADSTKGSSESEAAAGPRSSLSGSAAVQPVWELSSFSGGKYFDDGKSKYRMIARLLHIHI